jgi:radical SAM protein with 4Fe4S-binding SPASM domain
MDIQEEHGKPMNDLFLRFFRSGDFSAGACRKGLVFFAHGDSSLWGIPELGTGWHERLFDDAALLQNFFQRLQTHVGIRSLNARVIDQYWSGFRGKVSALNLNLTSRCNLECVYCYARGGDYNRIHGDMTPETAVAGVREALKRADPERSFRLEFFGGEPLLNLEAIEAVLAMQETDPLWKDRPFPGVNRISTNLSSEAGNWLGVIDRGNMIVSVSLDGMEDIQDSQRPFKSGKGSFAVIMKNLQRLRLARPDLPLVARITVFHQDGILADTVRRLVDMDIFDYVSIYPAALPPTNEGGKTFFSRAFRDQVVALAREYPSLISRGRFKGWLELNRYLECMLLGKAVGNHCRAGAGYFTLSPEGSFHPCHRLIGDESWDVRSLLADEEKLRERLLPWQTSVHHRERCRTCEVRYLCGGGCKQQALAANGSLLAGDSRTCSFSHLLWEASLYALCALSESERFTSGGGWSAFESSLGTSFRESERMFVFCGQPVILNQRTSPPSEFSLEFADRLWTVRSLAWKSGS